VGEIYINACPRCKGAVLLDAEKEAVCLNCGNRRFHKANLLIKIVEQAKKSLVNKSQTA
jgi:DNA-directed RNA polymerase subunit RPC12/RpoP